MSKFDCLAAFLPEEELIEAAKTVPEGDTPLWLHWIEYVQRQQTFNRSPGTTRSVRDALRIVVRRFKFTSIESCNNKNNIENALVKLRADRGLATNTYNSYLKNIKSYLIFLKRRGVIETIELDNVEKFPHVVGDQYVQTDDQVMRVIANLNTRRQTTLERLRNIFFYKLLLMTGARPSELELLTLDSIKRNPGQWTIKIAGTKNKPRNRFYNLPSSVKDSYIAYILYRQQLKRTEPFLFVSQSKRTGWTAKGMRYLLKKLSQELGFTVGLYSTRRYVATKLAREGASIHEISDHLGHTRHSTTKIYIQQCAELTRKNVDKLELIFGTPDPMVKTYIPGSISKRVN